MPDYDDDEDDDGQGEYNPYGDMGDDEKENERLSHFEGLEVPDDFLSRFDDKVGENQDGSRPELANYIYDPDSLVNYLENTPAGVLRVIERYDEDAEGWYWEIYRYDS